MLLFDSNLLKYNIYIILHITAVRLVSVEHRKTEIPLEEKLMGKKHCVKTDKLTFILYQEVNSEVLGLIERPLYEVKFFS